MDISYSNLPFTNTITDVTVTGNSVVYVPAFPGAYFYNAYPATDSGSFFPIYTSISNFSTDLSFSLNDVDKSVIVLPGYTLEMYTNINYGTLAYTIDSSGDTDYKMSLVSSTNSATSCKLYYTPASLPRTRYLLPYRPNPNPIVLTGGGTTSYSTVSNIPYVVFTFTTTGTMSINFTSSVPTSSFTAQFLVVAGGGSGGTANTLVDCAGGGGAGGVAIGTMDLSKNTTYTCTVGTGATISATNGANSSITKQSSSQFLLVYGGGAGARNTAAGNGGSGGGASANSSNHLNKGSVLTTSDTSNNTIGATVTFFGNAGGATRASGGNSAGGGGGGGAGAVGGNGGASGNTDQAGAGGNGTTWGFNSTVYGGGGGGGQASLGYAVPPGGTGGGGNGARNVGTNATSGTNGRGGGGGGGYGSDFGLGGNGIIIIAIRMSDLN